ncbi:MAG TPA: PQQ-binding-like beta-propeller repeat protein, partial [Pirellulales bacterium]
MSAEKNLPAKFTSKENVAWRLPMPGQAGSTPIVWNDRIFLTSCDNDKLILLCATTDGKELWRKTISAGNKTIRGDEGNLASASPSTDGKHVWAYVGTGDLACFDFDGNEIWKFNLQDRYGKFQIQWGMHVTPLLDGDRLYTAIIQGPSSKVVALDKNTGKEIWQQPRITDAKNESEQGYSSPIIYRDGHVECLLTLGGDYIVAHNLKDGSEIWRCGGLNVGRYNPSLRLIASPT